MVYIIAIIIGKGEKKMRTNKQEYIHLKMVFKLFRKNEDRPRDYVLMF